MPDRQFVFAPFRLDLVSEQLWRGEELVPLRPKLFALLRHLVEHAGRFVTREELRAAVWPTTVVSESVLRGTIRELREVLGDDANAARFVETVPHRGYRFVAPVTATQPVHAATLAGRQSVFRRSLLVPSMSLLIGRDAELAQPPAVAGARRARDAAGRLRDRRARDRQDHPGGGVSGLRRGPGGRVDGARAMCRTLRRWRGLPARAGGAGAALPGAGGSAGDCRSCSRYAPTWLVQMPGLLGDAELEAVQRRVQGATRERMLRELAEALEALTAATPLVLVLEDLHWSDLLHARPARPAGAAPRAGAAAGARDVSAGRGDRERASPESAEAGTARPWAMRGAAAGVLHRREVAQYLAARFPRQQLPPSSGAALHQEYRGQPVVPGQCGGLLAEPGVLVEAAGQWQVAARVEDVAAGVPESLRQMIEKQVERLTAEERRLLEVASVAGAEFSTAAVAAALGKRTARRRVV